MSTDSRSSVALLSVKDEPDEGTNGDTNCSPKCECMCRSTNRDADANTDSRPCAHQLRVSHTRDLVGFLTPNGV